MSGAGRWLPGGAAGCAGLAFALIAVLLLALVAVRAPALSPAAASQDWQITLEISNAYMATLLKEQQAANQAPIELRDPTATFSNDGTVLIKGGLRAGDRVFLSKPLGTGVVTTAAKDGVTSADVLAGAVASMLRLNRVAAEVAVAAGATGATDITGFGFAGHAAEMIEASGAGLVISASRVPLLPGALALVEAGHFSGGMKRNRRHVDALFGARLRIAADVPASLAALLFEAETSGGLLFAVAPERAGAIVPAFRERGEACWEIGEVVSDPVLQIRS